MIDPARGVFVDRERFFAGGVGVNEPPPLHHVGLSWLECANLGRVISRAGRELTKEL